MPNLIEIFRGGTHTDMRGTTLAFGESEIVDIAAAYDPALSEAPIVIGHPRTDAPAYGWVKSLSARGDRLYAEPDQVDAAFAELVESGRYKKVSACFYRPAAPANPKPGAYYLRHVGFLGAQPPAVKGLAPVEFAESPEDDLLLVEFADHESVSLLSRVLSLFRGVRDYIVERDGTEKADAVIPNGVLESMKEQATVALVLPPDPEPAYSEENVMSDDKKTVPPCSPPQAPRSWPGAYPSLKPAKPPLPNVSAGPKLKPSLPPPSGKAALPRRSPKGSPRSWRASPSPTPSPFRKEERSFPPWPS